MTACRAAFDVEIKCLQLHIYGQLSLKITGLAGFGKRMNRPVMQVLEFRRGELGRCRAQRVVRASRIAQSVGARYDEPIELSDSTTRKIDAFEMYCPRISAHESARVTVVDHFPNVAKIGEYAKHFRIDFRFDVGLHIGSVR